VEYSSTILGLGTIEVSDQLRATAALLAWEETPLPIALEEEWAQGRSRFYGEEKDLLPLPGIESRPSSPVTFRYTDWGIPVPNIFGMIYITVVTEINLHSSQSLPHK
jgi:hypothetical protein